LFSEAWGKAASVSNALAGFRACGLYPVDREAVPDYAYLPSSTSEMPIDTTQPSSSAVAAGDVQPQPSISSEQELVIPTSSIQQQLDVSGNTSFSELQPSPHISSVKRPTKNGSQKAAVLTSEGYRCSLIEKFGVR